MMKHLLRRSALAGIATFVLSAPAWAQVTAEQPSPHPATCADFHKLPNGMWQPNGEIQIASPNGSMMIGPSGYFSEEATMGGYNVAKWLDDNCPAQ